VNPIKIKFPDQPVDPDARQHDALDQETRQEASAHRCCAPAQTKIDRMTLLKKPLELVGELLHQRAGRLLGWPHERRGEGDAVQVHCARLHRAPHLLAEPQGGRISTPY
jgi:hypothetical protein